MTLRDETTDSSRAYREISRIPHLAELRSELRLRYGTDNKKTRVNEGYLEQLPHALTSAACSLLQTFRAEHRAISNVLQRPDKREEGIVYAFELEEYDRDAILFAVDSFLEAAARAQNAVTWYLGKTLSLSLPISFSDVAKDVTQLPSQIGLLVQQYWQASGKRLRTYRDLSQHYAVPSTEGRVYVLPSGEARIHVVLPNNPEVKSIAELTYGEPDINAYEYMRNSYVQLYQFLFDMTGHLLKRFPPPHKHLLTIDFKGGMRFDPQHVGQLLPSEEAEISALIALVRALGKG
jgi:hypothetical protein